YNSRDGSKNSFILAVLCCGEGWHNNHHYYQSSVNQGWFWWEVDFSYYILTVLSWFGIVWDLRTPPAHIKSKILASGNA
ncbi:MAG: acyl-CoA desaturase, partial [Nitrospiraceae bacterium]